MSNLMTSISLPGSSSIGLADWGRHTPQEMIEQIRSVALADKKAAEEILAASDGDFKIQTYYGPYVRRNKKIIQEGRKPCPTIPSPTEK